MNDHIVSVRTYAFVFAALLGLLVLTVAAAYLPHGWWSVVVALTIAFVKTALIMLFFMHLSQADGLTRVFALSGVAWLAILFVFLMSDYLTRDDVVRMMDG